MKRKVTGLVIVVAMAVLIGGVFLLTSSKNHGPVDAAKLVMAVQRYCSDEKNAGRPVPAEISVGTLISGGYLAAQDVSGFDGMEVTISTEVDEIRPREPFVRARFPDGTVVAVISDGSVQRLE